RSAALYPAPPVAQPRRPRPTPLRTPTACGRPDSGYPRKQEPAPTPARGPVMPVAAILALVLGAHQAAAALPPPGRFPAADNDDAWARLPRENPPLPPWARVLVGPLPKTTARMLELDYLHREKNPLGPVLAGKLRWAAADALGCKFGVATAEADLRRAGLTDADL